MRILYGVVGEGMGHATRSRVVIEHLLNAGHQVKVVVSGRAHKFLTERFVGRSNFSIEEIHGLQLVYEGNRLNRSESVLSNLGKMPRGLWKNLGVFRRVRRNFDADMAFSDFESWAYFFAKQQRIPVVSIDNIQMVNRCYHTDDAKQNYSMGYRVVNTAVKFKLIGAYHYLVTSFFYPTVRKPRTTLLPPILRPEILAAKREPGEHVLVYQTSSSNYELIPTLQKLPYQFRVYGMNREGTEKNVTMCSFSEKGFIDDLRTAKAVVAGGGFSLMCEAVHLHVPMLSVPIEAQFEQELNAYYIDKLGFGAYAREPTADAIEQFLGRTDEMSHNLESYIQRDNQMLLDCVDELVRTVASGSRRPDVLQSPALGKWSPSWRDETKKALLSAAPQ